jgi:hypothetical protein
MLRRTIAALLSITLAILVLPCITAAQTQKAPHACCEPTIQAASPDCCNSAAPHPATVPVQGQRSQAAVESISFALPGLTRNQPFRINSVAFTTPPARTPATILRT